MVSVKNNVLINGPEMSILNVFKNVLMGFLVMEKQINVKNAPRNAELV
jgi:hypothetical protein